MLAGPNGAGKSTFYDAFLAESPLPFLNADLVAAELQLDSFEAARLLDATRQRRIEDGLGFITETVFSDPYGH
jgi:predicted ABC-type ATPase